MSDNLLSVEVTISGRVQGVGYRDWLCRAAQASGVSGWCRNTRAGEVEAVMCGDAAIVHQLLRDCADGPRFAQVTAVQVTGQVEPVSGSFDVRATV